MFHANHSLSKLPCEPHCMNQISQWLETCTSIHPQCRPNLPAPYIELRMLHLSDSSETEAPGIRLAEGIEITERFAALSHCWGGVNHIMTTKSSLAERKDGISLSTLPKTFQDAVAICRFLGIKYLWIDSLCIIQDDEMDWEEESHKMGSVYHYAHLVISADAAKDSAVGCFTQRDVSSTLNSASNLGNESPPRLYARHAIEHAQYTTAYSGHEHRNPLEYRAWVLQEWLLGRRLLHFTRQEIVWDCKSGLDCECGGVILLEGHRAMKQNFSAGFEGGLRTRISASLRRPRGDDPTTLARLNVWLDVIEEYTMRRLTKSSDRMTAISGLASEIGSSDPGLGDYVCGFFQFRLAEQLLWSRSTIDDPPSRRSVPVLAPSWSWGSIHQPVDWEERSWLKPETAEQNLKTIASASIDTGNSHQFGQVVTGMLTIVAPTIAALLPNASRQNLEYGMCLLQFSKTPGQEQEEVLFSIDVDLSEELLRDGIEVVCVKIMDGYTKDEEGALCSCLILIRSAADERYLQRIGSDHNIPASWYSGAENQSIVIH
jgi:hypothetical protein